MLLSALDAGTYAHLEAVAVGSLPLIAARAEALVIIGLANGCTQGRAIMSERRLHESPYELLQHDHYRAEEAAEALLIRVEIIRHAVFSGELPAKVVNHEIVSIDRHDLVTWFRANEESARRG